MFGVLKRKWPLLILVLVIGMILITTLSLHSFLPKSIPLDLRETINDSELALIPQNSQPDTYKIGFDHHFNSVEEAQKFLPLLDYLSQATGLNFTLYFTPQNKSIGDELGTGTIQFGSIGALTYLKAKEQFGVVSLVRSLGHRDNPGYQAMIIVAPDSPIQSVEDLKGKSFAFSRQSSTCGHLVPRIMLAKHSLKLEDLASYEFAGSHWNCANAVITGAVDAGGGPGSLALELASKDLVRILCSSGFYPARGIAANRDVPLEVRNQIKQALLDFKKPDPTSQNPTLQVPAFCETTDEDYTQLRQWCREFGLLSNSENKGEP